MYLPPRYKVKILAKRMRNIILIITVAIIAIGSIYIFSLLKQKNQQDVKSETVTNNVITEGDTQVINAIAYSGGYSPSHITADAGKKTVLRLESKNSYGCERSFRIPELNVSKILPESGITEFDLGIPEKGEKIVGSCSMGMYTLSINFK